MDMDAERSGMAEESIQLIQMSETNSETSPFLHKRLSDSLHQLYGHRTSDGTKIDIVFFHGVAAGDYEDTWRTTWMTDPAATGANQPPVCWPGSWLGVEYPQSRILAASYDSSAIRTSKLGRVDMKLLAESLEIELIVLGKLGCRPFVMVGHSLGCLVIKQLIMHVVTANRIDDLNSATGDLDYKRQEFLNNLRGCFFYSPPSHGVSFNIWEHYFPQSAGPLMTDLEVLNSNTQRLNEEFRKWRHGQIQRGLGGVPVWAIWESNTSIKRGLMNREGVVVSEASARFDVDNLATVAANHTSVCQPSNREHDSRFLNLLEFLKSAFDMSDLKSISQTEQEKIYIEARQNKRSIFLWGTLAIFLATLLTEFVLALLVISSYKQFFVEMEDDMTKQSEVDDEWMKNAFSHPGELHPFPSGPNLPSFFSEFPVIVAVGIILHMMYFICWLGLLVFSYNLEPRGNPLWLKDIQFPQQRVLNHIMRGPPP